MLVLASASPRRQELLRNARFVFKVQPAHIPEEPLPGEAPEACAQRLAREKARVVYLERPQDYVLAADTIVVVDGQILNKPVDEADAMRMLRLLSGKTHRVITGVCLVGPAGSVGRPDATGKGTTGTAFSDTRSETTEVVFHPLSEQEIADYVATGEPMDKAGAYAIQGVASRWISRIDGCYFNVVGLPVPLVYRMLKDRGVR
jgi:septum formation protein